MNYLAHIYLSGDNELVTIGNFMADGIKGKDYKTYSSEIQKGILLHREIDTFTDANQIVRQSTKRLHKRYGHYSGVIVDILYDHFLAKNWDQYSGVSLNDYIDDFYTSLDKYMAILPPRILRIMPYMVTDNWLLSYASIDGIQRVFNGMNRRLKHIDNMNKATEELEQYYEEFESEFTAFFAELMSFSTNKLKELNSKH
jgi:acyl carrier protein phosphodiesterase